MHALSIKQPWAYCITDLSKRVENRTWRPPMKFIGERIAIHASKKHEMDDWIEAMERGLPYAEFDDLFESVPTGAIVGTARLIGVVDDRKPARHFIAPGGVVLDSGDYEYDLELDPWWIGPVGWIFDDVVKLNTPIQISGKLGLWGVPDGYVEWIRKEEQAKQ